ncbi:EcsC family protein [Oerskovia sp. NPDC060338]|uniref:EcsC family protein n=1 Tax=Oerskovia sp. NPDC060338 TaxID=3347100 RepID=UPI003665DCCD
MSATATENAPNDPDDATDSRVERVAARLTALVGSVVADGVGPVSGSVEWAESRLARVQKERYDPSKKRQRNPDEDVEEVERVIKRLVIESTQAAGANGFVTGLGGLVAMPVTIPANMAGALIINARLAGGIAYLRGYDLHDPHILTMVTLVSAGSTAQQVLSAFGAKVGQQFAMEAIKAIPISVLRQVNKKAGFFLVAKYGTQRAAITLAKVLPIVGGVVGGAVDATLTQLIARTAKSLFPRDIDDMPERKPRRRRRDETADEVA